MKHFFALFLLLSSPALSAMQPDDRLDPGQGAVLLTVSVDYPSLQNVNALPGLVPPLTVERIGAAKPERFILPFRLDGLQQTRAYAGSLPPGRYRIHDLLGGDCRLWCGDGGISVPKAGDLADFVIEAGRVRYLGSVMVSVRSPVPPAKEWQVFWAHTETPDAGIGQRLLSQLYPQLGAANTQVLDIGWEPHVGTTSPQLARENIRRANSGLYEPSPFGKDGLLFGALNGVVKRWNRAEGVRLLDTGSPYLIRGVLRSEDGKLLAGGEASTLLSSDDDGRSWKDASAGLPWGIVLQIKSLGGDELLFSLQHGKSVSLYRGGFADLSWSKVGEWPLEFATWTGLPGAQPEMQLQGRKVALTLPSKKGVFVDLDSGATHDITPPGSLANFTYTADGVMRCTCFRSIAANPWESRDLGKTWVDSPLDRWMVLPAFRDARHGFSYKGALFSKKKTGVMLTRDGGATWTQRPPMTDPGVWRPTYSADGSLMFFSGIAFRKGEAIEELHWSADEGATWTPWVHQGLWAYPATTE